MSVKPILIDLPEAIATSRLLLKSDNQLANLLTYSIFSKRFASKMESKVVIADLFQIIPIP